MINFFIFILILFQCSLSTSNKSQEILDIMSKFLAENNYPFEKINITTEDNTTLTLLHIPFSPKNNQCSSQKPVLFLQHGLQSSSIQWFRQNPNDSIACIVADEGFDVWLGNARDSNFRFSDTDFAIYHLVDQDLPAMIDYVLEYTGQDCLHYLGYSQGSKIMFLKLAEDLEFNKKICQFFSIGPVMSLELGIMEYFHLIIDNFLTNFWFIRMAYLQLIRPSFPHNWDKYIFKDYFYNLDSINLNIYFFWLCTHRNMTQFTKYLNEREKELYFLNISTIVTPTYIYDSKNDTLNHYDTAQEIYKNISKDVLKKITSINQYNHFDFITNENIRKDYLDDIIKSIREYNTKQNKLSIFNNLLLNFKL